MASRALSVLLFAALAPGLARGAGYEFEGVGARQVARAGAAVADSEDWTAMYWNPANIAPAAQKQGAELGAEAFGGMAYVRDSNSLSALPGVGAVFGKDTMTSGFVLGALGGLIPLGKKGGLGFGFYTPLLQGANFTDSSASTGATLDFKTSLGVLTWTLSGSLELSPGLYAGAGLDVLYGALASDITLTGVPFPGASSVSRLRGDGIGEEGIFGLRYDPLPAWSFGAVYRTGADITLRGSANASANFLPSEAPNFRFLLRHPATSGFGAAFRPARQWTLTLDFDQTYWHTFSNAVVYSPSGTLLASAPNSFQWRDTWKLRAGVRRRLGEATELLGGYSYDTPAVDPASIDLSTVVDVPMHRLYGGVSRRWSRRLETTAGAVGGVGRRTEQGVNYRLSGFQLMAETRLSF